jgi:hypothetical protein
VKRLLSAAVVVVMLGALSGCEWDTSDSGQYWNDSFNWANFTGLYKSPSGGILVRSFTTNPGTTESQQSVVNELLANGVAGATQYAGVLANGSVVPGSVTITAGGFVFVDNGDGTLTGIDFDFGTIEYATGAWSINLMGDEIPGDQVRASYVYTVGGSDATVEPGNSGTPIYSLNVLQEGNLLQMTASDGTLFTGSMGNVRSTVGDLQELPAGAEEEIGVIVASFEVNAPNVRIVGTLQGTLNQEEAGYGLFDRQMQATWIEANGTTADIIGTAGTVGVELPEPALDDRPDFEEETTTP